MIGNGSYILQNSSRSGRVGRTVTAHLPQTRWELPQLEPPRRSWCELGIPGQAFCSCLPCLSTGMNQDEQKVLSTCGRVFALVPNFRAQHLTSVPPPCPFTQGREGMLSHVCEYLTNICLLHPQLSQGIPGTSQEPRLWPLTVHHLPTGYSLSCRWLCVQVLPSAAMWQGYSKLSPLMVTKDMWEPLGIAARVLEFLFCMVKDLGWPNSGSDGGQPVSQLPNFPRILGLFFPTSTDPVPTRQEALISPCACDTPPG